MLKRLSLYVIAIICVGIATPLQAAERISPVSTTTVHRIDAVDAAKGAKVVGSIEFALRDGDTVRYFATAENCAEYFAHPEKYADVEPGARLAFMGADIVARFPNGVHSPAIGNLLVGDPAIASEFKGVKFLFASADNKQAFERNPAEFALPVGGYCLGAMSVGRLVPGDPRYVLFIPEAHTWAVFGSAKGPEAWSKMTSRERRITFKRAEAHYRKLLAGKGHLAAK